MPNPRGDKSAIGRVYTHEEIVGGSRKTDQAQNTDTELWRKTPDDYYSPSIFVTAEGAIGINVGGYVIVQTVEQWHNSAQARARLAEAEGERDRLRAALDVSNHYFRQMHQLVKGADPADDTAPETQDE